MRNLLKCIAIIGLVAASGTVASAQGVNVRIGVGDGDRYERRVVRERYAPVTTRQVIERRIVRPVPRTRTVCRTVIRERVTRAGVIVRRPTEVCRTRTRY